MGFCISYVLGSKTTNIHTLTDRPQKMCSLSSRPWMCLCHESPFCPATMTPVGILLVEFSIVSKSFFFFPSDGLSLNKITWDVKRTSILCEHCDSVFTFTSHGFTQLHLDSCTMCVAMAGVFSLMWVLLFHGPCTVYSSLYGHCDCFQLFARRKKNCEMIFLCMELWYKYKDPPGNSSRRKMIQNPGQSSYHQHSARFSCSVFLAILCCWVIT